METELKNRLVYKDYNWSAFESSKLDSVELHSAILFNKNDGKHMLDIIYEFMNETGYNSEFTAKSIERIIRNKLPEGLTQKQVKDWLHKNFKFNM